MKRGKLPDPFYLQLHRVSDARHSDDYALNKALRANLEVKRKGC
ncbi:hypothetical protein MANES_06G072901v8 [Manihot esculenta]|uniref:Uncharacterized protein n=1 Tax=Manihot esculenta TaxID=3983 RepID=A0ACB7HJW4_MANES|nr:hypothetical protein MANES_06G072901v8 [Manihot esculenta]